MKKIILIASILFPFFAAAQYKAQSECENHNKFLKVGTSEIFTNLVDTIYSNGMVYFNLPKFMN